MIKHLLLSTTSLLAFIFIPILTLQTPSLVSNTDFGIPNTCELPCWNQIVPGQTTLKATREFLKTVDFYNLAEEKREFTAALKDGQLTDISWRYDNSYPGNGIRLKDGIVSWIQLYPQKVFTLTDTLEKYGDPDGVAINYGFIGARIHIDVGISLYYYKRGLIVDFLLYTSDKTSRVDQVKIEGDAKGYRFRLLPETNNFTDFALSAYMDPYRFLLEGWPGLDSTIVNNFSSSKGIDFPTIIMPDGHKCCVLEASAAFPRWFIFSWIETLKKD